MPHVIGLALAKAGRRVLQIARTCGIAVRRMIEDDCFTRSAAIAYYGIVSIFPLLLLLIGVLGFFLEEEQTQRRVLSLAGRYFPAGSRQFIRENITSIIAARDSISLLSFGGLLWSATLLFDAVSAVINAAWRSSHQVAFVASKLRSLLIVSLITFIVLVSTLLTTQAALLFRFQDLMAEIPWMQWTVRMGGDVAASGRDLYILAMTFLAFLLAYRFLPSARVRFRNVWLGAALGALVWEASKRLFVWYVTGVADYTRVYGPLSAVLLLLLWTYVSAMILMWGAEFTAAYAQHGNVAERDGQEPAEVARESSTH